MYVDDLPAPGREQLQQPQIGDTTNATSTEVVDGTPCRGERRNQVGAIVTQWLPEPKPSLEGIDS